MKLKATKQRKNEKDFHGQVHFERRYSAGKLTTKNYNNTLLIQNMYFIVSCESRHSHKLDEKF